MKQPPPPPIDHLLLSTSTDPYANLALEEYLLSLRDTSGLLLLWRGERSVVLGRNQNVWQECQVPWCERQGISIARRCSGGGSVFHDLGNLNLTAILPSRDFHGAPGHELLVPVLRAFGLAPILGPRYTLLLGHRKFSGSAFRVTRDRCLHHLTVLVATELPLLQKALNAFPPFSRGSCVSSVPSPLLNVSEMVPGLTPEMLVEAIIEHCGIPSESVDPHTLEDPGFRELFRLRRQWDWCFGASPPGRLRYRLDDGLTELELELRGGRVVRFTLTSHLLTDSFEPRGCRFRSEELLPLVVERSLPSVLHKTLVEILDRVC